jgi:hypothetical protein
MGEAVPETFRKTLLNNGFIVTSSEEETAAVRKRIEEEGADFGR